MKHLLILCLVGLTLAACGPTAEVPTPLPTAVPPEVDQFGNWGITFQHEFPVGTFGPGPHRFRYLGQCPILLEQDFVTEWIFFEISEDAELQSGPVYLRLRGLSAEPLLLSYPATATLHPEQQIIAVVHFIDIARSAADLAVSGCEILIFWDEMGRQLLKATEPFEQ